MPRFVSLFLDGRLTMVLAAIDVNIVLENFASSKLRRRLWLWLY